MSPLYCERYGSGKPIVMLHGWAMHSGIWRDFAQQLAQSWQVTCVDLPGHGRSASIDAFNLDSVVEQLAASLDKTPACWLGWSMGANISIAMAQRYPERVSSLALLAGNPRFMTRPDWPGIDAQVLDSFADNLLLDCNKTLMRFLALQCRSVADAITLQKKLKLALNECANPDNKTLIAGLELLKTVDQVAELKAINCPLLMILGAQDTLIPAAIAAKTQALLAHSEIHVLAKTGHLPFLTQTRTVLGLINQFLVRQA